MSGFFLYTGLAFIIIGVLIVMLFALGKPGEGTTEVGVGGFIGPVPFGFATNKGMLYLVIALSVVMAAAFLVMGR